MLLVECEPSKIRWRLADFYDAAIAAQLPEATRLAETIQTWWPAILVALTEDASNARTEGLNRIIKQTKRISVNRPSLGGIAVVCGLPESAAERADTGRSRCSRRNADGVSGGGCRWRAGWSGRAAMSSWRTGSLIIWSVGTSLGRRFGPTPTTC